MSANSDLNNGNNDDQIDKMTDVVEVEDFSDEVDEEPKCDDDDDVSGGGESDTGREPRTRGRHTYIPQEEDDDNGVYDEEEEPQYPQHPIDSDAFDEEEEEEEEDKKTPHITDEIKEVFGDDEEEEERIAEEERLEEEKRQREEEDEENERRREEEEEDQKRRAEEEEKVRQREEEENERRREEEEEEIRRAEEEAEEERRRAEEEEENERRREEEEEEIRRAEEEEAAKRREGESEETRRAEEEADKRTEEEHQDTQEELQEGSVDEITDGAQPDAQVEERGEDESPYSDDVIHDDNTSEEVNDKVGDAPNDEVCPDADHEVGDAVDVDELEAESKDGGIHDKEVCPEDETPTESAEEASIETADESVENTPDVNTDEEPVEEIADVEDEVLEEQADGETSESTTEVSEEEAKPTEEDVVEEDDRYAERVLADEYIADYAQECADSNIDGASQDAAAEFYADGELVEEDFMPSEDDGLVMDAGVDTDVTDGDIREITLYRATKDGAVGAFWSDSKPLDRLAAKTDYQLPIFYEGDTPDKSTYNNRDSVVTGKIKVDGEGFVLNYDTEEPITIPRYSDDGEKVGYERVRYDDRLKDIEVIPSNGMNEANVTPSALNDTCVADRNILAPANRRDLIDIDGRLVTGKHEISFANKGMSRAESDAVVNQVVRVVETEKLGYHSNFAKHMKIERALKSKK